MYISLYNVPLSLSSLAYLPTVDVSSGSPEVSYQQRHPLSLPHLPLAISYSLFERYIHYQPTVKSPKKDLPSRPVWRKGPFDAELCVHTCVVRVTVHVAWWVQPFSNYEVRTFPIHHSFSLFSLPVTFCWIHFTKRKSCPPATYQS